jgi:hypothetical protein
MIETRIRTFPEGQRIVLLDNEVVGFLCTLLIKDYDLNNTFRTWDDATAKGFIKGRHNPEGETVYGVNLSVMPTVREHNIGRMLVQNGIEHLVVGANRPMTVLGGRLSGYDQYCRTNGEISADEYLEKSIKGETKDPSVSFFLGLQFRGVYYRAVRVLPDYFPDPFSRDNGVLLAWENKLMKQ